MPALNSFRRNPTPSPFISWIDLNDSDDEIARRDDEADRAEYESNQDDEYVVDPAKPGA